MGQDNVDIWLLQSLEARFEALYNMLSAQATSVWLLTTCTEEDLGR